jgi:hypothetical protein
MLKNIILFRASFLVEMYLNMKQVPVKYKYRIMKRKDNYETNSK